MDNAAEEKDPNWPSWRYGPNGEADIFNSAAEVPSGWKKHPSHFEKGADETEVKDKTPRAAAPAKAKAGAVATGDESVVDADGWPWDASLHAATKNKTSAGLWRMKVGVARPAPKKAKPPLDL